MNLNKQIVHDNHMRLIYSSPQLLNVMGNKLTSWLPSTPQDYIVVCIGTDRSTGDSLGPLTGTYLKSFNPKHITVYGTLHNPVHAMNLEKYIDKIFNKYCNPFIIAVDACLGKTTSIGHIICGKGPIQPGAALNKPLPLIGDLHLTGVVNVAGFMEHTVLQNTRLSLVSDMAEQIANVLNTIDDQLIYSQATPAVLQQHIK